jgi:hypothetical protein
MAHSLIEDTLILLLVGSALSGILGLRLLFAILFSLLITRVYVVLTARAG